MVVLRNSQSGVLLTNTTIRTLPPERGFRKLRTYRNHVATSIEQMRNYRDLSPLEMDELISLYPTTTNRELSRRFDISVDAIQDNIASVYGLKKDRKAVLVGNRGYSLSEEDTAWIIKHYKHTKNADIMARFNIGESTLHRCARKHGLKKSKVFMKKTQRENAEKGYKVCLDHGVYEQNAEYTRKQWEEWKKLPRDQWPGRKVGVKPQHQPGVSTRRYNKRMKEGFEKRRQTVRRERARLVYGLEQKTSLNLTKTMTHKMSAHKHAMIKHCNYFPDEEHPTWLFYDNETTRSARRESHAVELGLKVYPSEDYTEAVL